MLRIFPHRSEWFAVGFVVWRDSLRLMARVLPGQFQPFQGVHSGGAQALWKFLSSCMPRIITQDFIQLKAAFPVAIYLQRFEARPRRCILDERQCFRRQDRAPVVQRDRHKAFYSLFSEDTCLYFPQAADPPAFSHHE